MREVAATDAKAHLAELLRAVEYGETVAITRHGKTVAARDEEALVPHDWHVEVRSALLAAERRRRLGPDEVDDCLRRVRELPVRTDAAPDVETAFSLAPPHGMSLYDALYLELALSSDAHLATLDQALASAADAATIPLIETVAGSD